MILLTGSAKRPSSPRKPGPAPGTVVAWRLSTPVADLAAQAEKLGWPCKGIVGNTDHLRGNGDHTPWSGGKQRGVIYAGDWDPPDPFEKWYVTTARSDYDTSWIDFININGRQYNNAGQLVASSGDVHLHVSVAAGHENTHVTLFTDYAGGDELDADEKKLLTDTANNVEHLLSLLHDGKRLPIKTQTAGGGRPIAWIVDKLGSIAADAAAAAAPPATTPLPPAETVDWPDDAWIDRVAARVVERVKELRLTGG